MKYIATFEDGTEATFDWNGKLLAPKTWHLAEMPEKVLIEIRQASMPSRTELNKHLEVALEALKRLGIEVA